MRIGLISDTHIPTAAQAIPPQVAETFQQVDLILHAGDIYTLSVLDELEKIAPVLAALGDDDSLPMLKDERIKQEHILNLEGHTVWLLHERLSCSMVASQQKQNGETDVPDIVVFGHEHTTCLQRVDNTLYINSGSPTFLHYKRGPGTVGILELNSVEPQASIISL